MRYVAGGGPTSIDNQAIPEDDVTHVTFGAVLLLASLEHSRQCQLCHLYRSPTHKCFLSELSLLWTQVVQEGV